MPTPRILLALSDPEEARTLADRLRASGCAVSCCDPRGGTAARALEGDGWTVVVAELQAGGADLLEGDPRGPEAPAVVLIDGFGSVSQAVDSVRRGAFDYLSRPTSPEQILVSVQRAVDQRALAAENARLRRVLDGRRGLGAMISRDPGMQRVFRTVESVAETHASVLITGESGTGKSMLAQEIHRRSRRAEEAFVEVHCGALPATLLESELFGHVKGAFTGAVADKPGKFEAADGGTIFLDEISTSSLELQIKLLRVLQERVVERVGDTRPRRVDVRVVCATNRDLEEEIAAGRFREDLFYRIDVVTLRIPPLRERPADVGLLAEAFLERFREEYQRPVESLHPETLARLLASPWPGNVRQLEHCLERAVLLCQGAVLMPEDLYAEPGAAAPDPDEAASGATGEGAPILPLKKALEEPEKRIIERALAFCDGNRTRTAALLGVNRTTLFNKMRKYDLLGIPSRGWAS